MSDCVIQMRLSFWTWKIFIGEKYNSIRNLFFINIIYVSMINRYDFTRIILERTIITQTLVRI